MRSLGLVICFALAGAACGDPGDGGGGGGAAGTGGSGGSAGVGVGGQGGSDPAADLTPREAPTEEDCARTCDAAAACLPAPPTGEMMAQCRSWCRASLDARTLPACTACFETATCSQREFLCSDSNVCEPTHYDLVVEAEGFEAWNGKSVYLLSHSGAEEEARAERGAEARIANGRFTVVLHDGVVVGDYQTLEVLVDADGNDECGAADLYFEHDLGPLAGPHTVQLTPPANAPSGTCWFGPDWIDPSLFVEGHGFDDDEGKWVVLVHGDGHFDAREVQTARIENGRFSVRYDYWYGEPAEIAFVIDDGDFVCEAGADRIGVVAGPELGMQPRVEVTPADLVDGDCAPFDFLGHDLTLRSTGWSANEGSDVYGVLVGADGEPVAYEDDEAIEGGAFELQFGSAALPGESYRILLFVDVDGDGPCNAGDESFAVDTGTVQGPLILERDRSELTPDPSLCDQL